MLGNFRLNKSDQSILEKEMIAYANEGASDEDLIEFKNTFISEKKKGTPQSEPTATTPKLVSETPTGSSGGVKPSSPQPKMKTFTGFSDSELKSMSSAEKPLPVIDKSVKEKINSPEAIAKRKEFQRQEIAKYRNATKLQEAEKLETQQELDAKTNQEGVWNNIKALGTKATNAVSDLVFKMTDEGTTPEDLKISTDPFSDEKKQAKEELLSEGIKAPSKIDIENKAKEIYTNNLNLEKKQQKINTYLESVDPKVKSALKIDANERFTSLSKEKKDATNRISLNEKYFEQLSDDLEDPNITEEDRINISNERNKIAKYLNTDYKLFSKKSEELGTAEDEFDAFKRNYNAFDNVSSRALYSLADAGISLYSGANYIANTLGAGEEYKQEGIKKAKEFIQEKREGFRPENKELTLDNFFQYSTDLLANQTGTLAQVGAGGIGGIVALGVEGAGDTYSEMYQDQKKGQNYSPTQMALAPFVSGLSTAFLSELPTISTLRNSANVWRSALKETAGKELIDKAIKTTGKSIVKSVAKNTGKEVATEDLDLLFQNTIKRDILGDKSVGYFDGMIKSTKDTSLLTGLIGTPGALAHVAISTVKTFSDKATQKQLNANAKKITALLAQLNNENISETSKKVIKEQIDIATKESSESVNKTIDKLGKMPLEQIEEVYNNSKRISELQQEATEIKSDSGLDDVAKKTLLSGLEEEYKGLESKNTEIINQTQSIKDAEAKSTITDQAKPETEVPQQAEAEKVEEVRDSREISQNQEELTDSVIEVKPAQKVEFIDESLPKTDIATDGSISTGVGELGESGITEQESIVKENVPSAVDVGASEKVVEVKKKYKLTEKGQSFNVELKDGKLEVTNEKGEPVSRPTKRAVLRKHADNFDFTTGEKSIDDPSFEPQDWESEVAKKSSNPSEIAEAIQYSQYEDSSKLSEEEKKDYKTQIIEDNLGKIKEEGFNRFGDRNKKTPKTSKEYFDENGREIDDLSQEMSEMAGVEITPNDIADFIADHPNGIKETKQKIKEVLSQEQINKSNKVEDLKNRFTELTGLPASNEFLLKAIEQQNRKNELNSPLDNMSDSDFEQLHNETKQFEKEEYGTNENEQVREGNGKSEDNEKSAKRTRVQKEDTPKSEPKPRKTVAERIKASNANIDDIANAIKGIDEIFGIKIKVDDIEGLKKQGVDMVDVIASIAKKAIAAGIHIDEAINKTIEHLKKTMDFDVNVDDVKERINPKKETTEKESEKEGFKRKQGKRTLLARLKEGKNSDAITESLNELNESYDVSNQKKADAKAKNFVDEVGVAESIIALRNGSIEQTDIEMLVYNEVLDRLATEIDSEVEKNPEDREALIQQFQEVSDAFDKAIRKSAQGLSVMNYIYNKNQSLKYSLSKLINDYKRNDPNGEIPKEVKEEFERLSAKLKDVEKQIKEAEERAKKAEDELAIKNIQEDIARKKEISSKNKSGLTEKEQARKKELRNKFFGRLNDVTSIATMLADKEFREYLGLTFKSAKGDLENFTKQIVKEIGEGAKKHAPRLFKEAQSVSEETITKKGTEITIDKDGKIKIPAQVFRDYVEAGETDIDVISQKIKDDISEEYPDVELREIRDALTGYGKQINPSKDEVTGKINRLKEYGRLLSAYEDVLSGEMPKKSGLKRPKPEQKSRELRNKINALAKELGLESVNLEEQWATAIDKIKSSLKNQIEELDKQIENGEKRKVERTTTKLDQEAEALKAERDEKRKFLDDLVGKPELTEEQKIARAEKSLETSITKLQDEIDKGKIEFQEKPTPLNSAKLENLRLQKKGLIATKKLLQEEAGLIEEKRLKTAKTRVKNQIEELEKRIENKDFAKKEVKPILADNELNTLRAEREEVYELFEKLKYVQELKNRSTFRKYADAALESLGLLRAIKASLDLGLIGIQLRGFTYSELFRNPKELGKKFLKMFGAIGSQKKSENAMKQLVGHPDYALSKKLDIGITHPDLRNEVREEMASGNLLNFIWNSPLIATKQLGGAEFTDAKKKALGDTIIDNFKKQYNKYSKNKLEITEKEKFTRAEQWKNVNAFEAIERGLSAYGNQLRFEEFVRGVERLKAEGKDPVNHEEDYKALASYIRTFSGRAKPKALVTNQKLLNVFFFSFKNAVSVFQQLNPWYMIYELNKANLNQGTFKPTVASKMAMATMLKSVTSTAATMLFITAAYNAFKDDDEEELKVETDPTSSDFGKIRIGDLRYDPWGGYVPLITLYARLITEEVKKSSGEKYKFGENRFGIEDRFDATGRFIFNKESPGFQMFHHYMKTVPKLNKDTGEIERVDKFGQTISEDEAFSLYPIFLGSVKKAIEDDPKAVESFLTAYSILGLGNVQKYKSKSKSSSGTGGGPTIPEIPSPPVLKGLD